MLAACGRILQPVIRLALALGLKHMHLQRLLTILPLDEGRQIWRAQGVDPNINQLSVTTALNRKAITARTHEPDVSVAQPELAAAAKTLTLWVQLQDDDASLARLPVAADSAMLSFEMVARQDSRGNLHHRAILDELLRLDLVQETDDHVVLNYPTSYRPMTCELCSAYLATAPMTTWLQRYPMCCEAALRCRSVQSLYEACIRATSDQLRTSCVTDGPRCAIKLTKA